MLLSDVTLREGDQLPGREYTAAQKVECARALDDLGVPFVQPAFPASGETDRSVVAELAGTTTADVVGLARAVERDVDAAVDAGVDVVETFVPVSDLTLEHLMGASREEMLATLLDAIEHAQDRGGTVHVTLADAFRADVADLVEVVETIPSVPYVTLADTVGARTPESVAATLDALAEDVDLSGVGVHFHDDLGCATANALAAYRAGVGKADVSVGALGERAGNSALEEVVAACALEYDDALGVEADALVPTCRRVLSTLEEGHGDRKAVLGESVYEHESPIHTAAMLHEPAALEAYDPASMGAQRRLVFGGSTGRSASRTLLERVGVDADDDTVDAFRSALAEHGPLDLDGALDLAADEFGD